MDRRKRYCVIHIMLILIVLSITACNKKESDSDENTAISYVPQYTMYEYEFDKPDDISLDFYGMFIQGDKLYCISRVYMGMGSMRDNLNVIDMSTGEQSNRQIGSAASYYRTVNGFVGFASKMLTLYDENFDKTGEIDLSGFIRGIRENGDVFSACDYIAVDRENNIGIISSNTLYMLNAEGTLMSRIECPDGMGEIEMVFATNAGEWYVLCNSIDYRDENIYPVDIESGALGNNLENTEHGKSVIAVCPVDENDFYVYTENYVYRYIAENSSYEKLICLRDYGVEIGNEIWEGGAQKGFGVLEDGMPGIIISSRGTQKNGKVKNVELVRLVTAEGEEAGRTELIAATIWEPTAKEREAVMRFNKYNPDYYITFRVYENMNYNADNYQELYRLAEQSFNNDLVSGKGADIYFSSSGGLDFENLGQKGVFADLYELIDKDENISREDFIQSILKAMEYNGKLYAVSPDFSLDTIVGKKSLLEKYDRWDFDALYDLAQSHSDSALLFNGTPETNLEKFMAYSLDMFYNSDTAECSFDSEQFIKLLELAKNCRTEYDVNADIGELLTNEKVLLYEAPIMFWNSTQLLPYYFGEDISYVGYPSGAESGTVIRYYYQWAVSGQTQHMDGAWQFIKSLFDDEYQRSCFYFPLVKADFEDMISDAMNLSESMEYSLASGVKIGIHAMTEAEADELRGLVDNATLVYTANDTVMDIINEEAQYFFAGTRSAGETAAIIQNRVQIYLDEKN